MNMCENCRNPVGEWGSGIYSLSENTLNSPLPQARQLDCFFIFLSADVLVKTWNQSQSQTKKDESKTQASLFLLLLLLQGRAGPKGDRGDPGLPGLQVSPPLSFCGLWTGNRRLSIESRVATGAWIQSTWRDWNHTRSGRFTMPSSGRRARSNQPVDWQTVEGASDAVKLLWSADSCYQRGNREWNMFFPMPRNWRWSLLVKDLKSLSDVWASLTHGRCHFGDFLDEKESQIKPDLL